MSQQFERERGDRGSTLTSRQKLSLAGGAVLLVLLAIFVFSNTDTQEISILAWGFEMPLGLALLFAAVAGALLWPLLRGLVRGMLQREERR